MNWKTSLIACVSGVLLLIPENIFSCADVDDSLDSFNGFFNKYAAGKTVFTPFYFSDTWRLTDDEEWPVTAEAIVNEWVDFSKGRVSKNDANDFVMKFDRQDLANLYYHIEANKPLTLPDSVARNQMTRYFLEVKDLEALGYLMYAKQVEPYVTVTYNSWDATPRDSVRMNRLVKNGLQLHKAAKSPAFQLKYGYQVVRLAHYNHEYQNAVQYYDDLISKNNTKSILQSMSLGLKAGALYRLNRKPEAAYIFSEIFNETDVKKIANYNSFGWALPNEDDFKNQYLTLCKNDKERANMLALYGLHNGSVDISLLAAVHRLSPGKSVMPTLVVREINKLEHGGFMPEDTVRRQVNQLSKKDRQLASFVKLLKEMAANNIYKDNGLFSIGAAYVAYLMDDFNGANELLKTAKKVKLSPRLEDQWLLTNLLVTIGERSRIDAQLEQKILPSLQWLRSKTTPPDHKGPYDAEKEQWNSFFDNVMVNVLASRYEAQGDKVKETLAYGLADENRQWNYRAKEKIRNELNAGELTNLYAFLVKKNLSAFESFLTNVNIIDRKKVADCLGTVYLRDYNYDKAIEWLEKEPQPEILKDPFKELLFDQDERLKGDAVTTTKLAYAKEMKALNRKPNDPQALYQMALGFYNTTYYGYAWELVAYFRSGVDGYRIPKDATAFQRDYYGCFKAQQYFEKAMAASNDPEFRAKCLFMIAKCTQKQLHKPTWGDTGYDDKTYRELDKQYYTAFKNNSQFAQYQKEFSNTEFYKETLTRCSYLRDFTSR